jgi:hypothetical protein
MSKDRSRRWSVWAVVATALATAVFALGALPAVLMVVMIPWSRDEKAYCGNPDHPGPCDRIQEMGASGTALLAVAALALLCAGAAVLARGWWLTVGGRGRQGTAMALIALLGLTAAYGFLAYGYSAGI